MKKKLTSLVLALVLCLSLCVPTFAVERPTITIGGIEYQQSIESDNRNTISVLESSEMIYKSIYDNQDETITIFVTSKENAAVLSDEQTVEPYLVIDLNEADSFMPPPMPAKSCEVLYWCQFMDSYYMYTDWDDGSYELLNNRNPIAFTPPNTISAMATKCENYYYWIQQLDEDGPIAFDTAIDAVVNNAMGALPLWSEVNAIGAILYNTSVGEDSTNAWLALITSAISAIPGLGLFGLAMDIANVAFRFGIVYEDITRLGNLYTQVYNYYN